MLLMQFIIEQRNTTFKEILYLEGHRFPTKAEFLRLIKDPVFKERAEKAKYPAAVGDDVDDWSSSTITEEDGFSIHVKLIEFQKLWEIPQCPKLMKSESLDDWYYIEGLDVQGCPEGSREQFLQIIAEIQDQKNRLSIFSRLGGFKAKDGYTLYSPRNYYEEDLSRVLRHEFVDEFCQQALQLLNVEN